MEPASMSRKRAIGAVVVLLGLPLVLAAFDAISFHVRNRNNGSIISSGERREYLLYVPRTYDPARPTPLVISMHGAGVWPALQMELSEWNKLADREGFIVVYPSGLGGAGPRVWHVGPGPGLAKDVRYISELIDKLEASYRIDPARIYANGFSNGGGMAFVLSCKLADRIAAVGMVGAAQTLPWSWCTEHRAVPMIAFHGTADSFAFYNGGQSWVAPRPFPAVQTWTANWARRNGCGPKPVESTVAAGVTRASYIDCAGGADVMLYTVHGGGHQWFGGKPVPEWFAGPMKRSIDATSQMWTFFRAHPLH
jgi:polyhydroxybutyrate depolymerase